MDALAQLEVWHSRPIAPTRRVALGLGSHLPAQPAPGFGGILLAGVVAAFADSIDEELIDEIEGLMRDLLADRPVAQPRLRHRLQVDRIGLTLSVHRLHGDGERLVFDLAQNVIPAPQVLAAIYEAGRLPIGVRRPVMELVRHGLTWTGGRGDGLVRFLTGEHGAVGQHLTMGDPAAWAREVLGLRVDDRGRDEINRRFRQLARAAHPDLGGTRHEAGARLDELTRARRILLG